MNHPTSNTSFDAIVIGAGHNGLAAAFYLAKSGLRPLVLERRDLVGGACVTEEFAPGYQASPAAHVLAMLRESIWTDMRLVERGIHVDASGPTLTVFPDGQHLLTSDDEAATLRRDQQVLGQGRRSERRLRRPPRPARKGAHAAVRRDRARPSRPKPR